MQAKIVDSMQQARMDAGTQDQSDMVIKDERFEISDAEILTAMAENGIDIPSAMAEYGINIDEIEVLLAMAANGIDISTAVAEYDLEPVSDAALAAVEDSQKKLRRSCEYRDVFKRFMPQNASEIDIVFEYQKAQGTHRADELLKNLLKGQDLLLKKICRRFAAKCASAFVQMDYEDYFQESIAGAILAFQRFKLETRGKSGRKAKLSTFVHYTVSHHLLDTINNSSPVKIAEKERAWRTYIRGGYDHDPAKKAEFERKHGLFTADDIAEAKAKHQGSALGMLSLDGLISDEKDSECTFEDMIAAPNQPTEDDIVTRLAVNQEMATLTSRQRAVFQLIRLERCSYMEAATELGVSYDEVRSDLAACTKAMARLRAACQCE